MLLLRALDEPHGSLPCSARQLDEVAVDTGSTPRRTITDSQNPARRNASETSSPRIADLRSVAVIQISLPPRAGE
jgi:hypothetical protein